MTTAFLPPELAEALRRLSKLADPKPVRLAAWAATIERQYAAHARTTRARMRQALRELLALPGAKTTRDLTPERLAGIAAAVPGRKKTTVDGLLRALHAAFVWSVGRGVLAYNPLAGAKCWDTRAATPRKHHARRQIARVLAALEADATTWEGRRLFAFAAVLAYCGLRLKEALRLQVADVDFAQGVIWVCPHGAPLKTPGSEAPVPIPRALKAILRGWVRRCGSEWLFPGAKNVGPWTGGSSARRAGAQLKAAAQAIGVPGMTPHTLRHSLATHLVWYGGTDKQVQSILRHTGPRMTARYIHPDLANLRDLVRDFDYASDRRAGRRRRAG